MKIKILSILAGAGLVVGSLFADSVQMSNTPNDGDLAGGEFQAVTTKYGTFMTFCLEKNIGISLPGTYQYTVDMRAFSGGADTHDVSGNPAGDNISTGTAWLYAKFHNNQLGSARNGTTYLADWDYNAGELQKAFWMLEDEMTWNGTNYYIQQVLSHFSSNVNSRAAAQANIDRDESAVAVMNLWKYDTQNNKIDVQSQLIYVPEGGVTAIMLGLSLLGLALLRRKL